jgi:hypothetical protein
VHYTSLGTQALNPKYQIRLKSKFKLRLFTLILVVFVMCSAIVYGSKNFNNSTPEMTINHFTAVSVNAVYEAESIQRVAPFFSYTVYFRDTSHKLRRADSVAHVEKDIEICVESITRQQGNISYRVVESSKCSVGPPDYQ